MHGSRKEGTGKGGRNSQDAKEPVLPDGNRYGGRGLVAVFCDHEGCIHNKGGGCSLNVISIEMKFGEFRSGERVCYPACQECVEAEDGDN